MPFYFRLAARRGAPLTISLFISLFISLLITGCAGVGMNDFDEPEVELLALEPMASQGMEARFLVKLRILNPNDTSLEIDGMAYDVSLRGNKVLSGVSNQPISVAPYSESIAELEVAAGVLGSLALIRDLMTNPQEGGMPYTLNAKLSRSGFGGAIRVRREGVLALGGARTSAVTLD